MQASDHTPLTPERIEEIEQRLRLAREGAFFSFNDGEMFKQQRTSDIADLLSEVKRLRAKEGMTSTQD